MSITDQNGQHTTYTSGKEGWKEGQGQGYLLSQTCASDGDAEREACRRSRIIHIENSSDYIKPFVLQGIATTQEVIHDVATIMNVNTYVLGFRVSSTRQGTWHREYLNGIIPRNVEDLYVSFYLRKHPH